jgi:hypothetical protein
MLSGIGAPSELEAANKSTIVALPSVGKNMSDHALLINVFTTTSNDTWANYTNPTVLQQQKSLWETTRQGPLSDPPANTVGWMRLSRDDAVMQEHGDPSTGLNSAHWEFLVSVRPSSAKDRRRVLKRHWASGRLCTRLARLITGVARARPYYLHRSSLTDKPRHRRPE